MTDISEARCHNCINWCDDGQCIKRNNKITKKDAHCSYWEEGLHPTRKLHKGKEKKTKQPKREELSFGVVDGVMYEQVHDFKFITNEGGFTDTMPMGLNGTYPILGEEVLKNVVLLPTIPFDYGSTEKLLTDIKAHIQKYYDCDEQHRTIAAWYVLMSWVYDRLNTIPYLRALGDFGTGKSRFLDVVGRICYKPIIGSGAGSVAALKRVVEKWKGTILIDEGDLRGDDEKNDFIKFLNLGFEKNRAIYQCDKNDPNKLEFYIPYCPKIITTRKDFADTALESRCLTHITQVTKRQDIPIQLFDEFYDEEMTLRNKLLKWRFDNYYLINPAKAKDFDMPDIEPRLKQAMASFTCLFANLPDMIKEFKKYIEEFQRSIIDSRAVSYDGEIIDCIMALLLDEDKEHITPAEVTERMKERGHEKANPGYIGKCIKGLGLKTIPMKIEGKTKRIIEISSNVFEVCKRYSYDKERLQQLQQLQQLRKTGTPAIKTEVVY